MKPIEQCRTWLFVPGADREALAKAPDSRADVLIQELEDFTPPERRPAARLLAPEILAAWKAAGRVSAVRINSLAADGQEDLTAVMAGAPEVVLLPMVQTREEMVALDDAVGKLETQQGLDLGQTKLVPTVETARGLVHTGEIASASPRIVAALLGAEDLANDLGAERGRDGSELTYARQRFLVECRAAGVIPIDFPYTWADLQGAVDDSARGRRLGYTAKAVVQPAHAEAINAVFTPSRDAIAAAERIVAAFEAARASGEGRALVDGALVEVPAYRAAKRLLERAKFLGILS